MLPSRWNFIQSLQEDLLKTSRYVEFNSKNSETYSVEFDRIILAACSEINSIFEDLALRKNISINGNLDILKAGSALLPLISSITSVDVQLVNSDISVFKPWDGWSNKSSPDWWGKVYNKLKHNRAQNFAEATLGNAIVATAALVVLSLYSHRLLTGAYAQIDAFLGPHLFSITDGVPKECGYSGGGVFWGYEIGL
jgi:hypothetical protein